MVAWLVALSAGVMAAAVQYGRSSVALRTAPLALLRIVAVTLVVALLLGAPAGRAVRQRPLVALDASESFGRAATGDACWRAALDSARVAGGQRIRFGESVREEDGDGPPQDRASALRPVADRAAADGVPVVVVTDGELDDGELLDGLPRGSRALVLPCTRGPDAALADLDAPSRLLAGDTLVARLTLAAGERGSPAGRLFLHLDDDLLATAPVPALGAYQEHGADLRAVARGAERAALLRASFRAAGDTEPRNDTLVLAVQVTRSPAAVFVSTAPDFDAREAIAALRGVTSLPTRAFYRVAPGAWRTDGTLARVPEAEVRAGLRGAPLVVIHGDTSALGPPRGLSAGSLLLFAPPPAADGEWFVRAAPPSPLAGTFGTMPFDSLSPLDVSPVLAGTRAQWQGLVAERAGAAGDRRPVLLGWEEPRRVAVLGASGLWRWRFHGGVRADAYNAFFGGLYDWLAAGRSDQRAAVPDGRVQRAGRPLRWRRGASADSVVSLTMRRRGATGRVQMVTLRFDGDANVVESPAAPPGIYEVEMAGGQALLAVNASPELVPRRPAVRSGAVGGSAAAGEAPSLRGLGWIYALVIAALCAEWLLRRGAGLR